MAEKPLEAAESVPESIYSGIKEENVKELQGQFDEQQQLIGKLRDALKHQETSKSQDPGMEDYAIRLAKMKPRLLRGRSAMKKRESKGSSPNPVRTTEKESESVTEKQIETGNIESQLGNVQDVTESETKPTETTVETAAETTIQGTNVPTIISEVSREIPSEVEPTQTKIQLLRRKLEENRIKFERQQRENVNKRAAMEDMKDRIEKLRTEVEERDHLIESLQDSGPADPNIHHLYQQILHKDNTIMELTDNVNQLEMAIKDQAEQLKEKDQIIAARTEAVNLVSKDKDEKLFSAINEVENLKDSMNQMQKDFQIKQETWSSMEKSLNAAVDDKIKKINILEENYQRLESVRFELSTTNAETQERLVKLQSQCQELNKTSKLAQNKVKLKEEEISELKKGLARAEAFGQKKLKVFEKYFKGIENEEVKEQVTKLTNDIALLEEEKGNLQWKLVDFDDMKDNETKMLDKMEKLQTEIDSMHCDIQSHLAFITSLENEKVNLVETVNKKNLQVNDVNSQLQLKNSVIDDLKQAKITLELKLCALEEERDIALKKSEELETSEQKGQMSSDDILEKQMLNEEISKLKEIMMKLEEKCHTYENEIKSREDEFMNAIEIKEQKVGENQCLVELLAEKESTITSQSLKIENNEFLLNSLQSEIKERVSLIQHYQEELTKQENKEQKLLQHIETSGKSINTLEDTIHELQTELNTKTKQIEDLHKTVKTLEESLLSRNKSLQKLEYKMEGALHEIEMKDQTIQSGLKRIKELENYLEQRSIEMKKLLCDFEEKCTIEKKLEEDLHNIKKSSNEDKSRIESEFNIMESIIKDHENQIKNLSNEIDVKDREISNNQDVISKFEQELCSKNKQMDELETVKNTIEERMTELQNNVLALEQTISEKNKELEDTGQAVVEKTASCNILEEEVAKKTNEIELLKISIEEMNYVQQGTTEELQNTKSSSMEICEFLQKDIDSKNNQLISLESRIEQVMSSRDQKILDLESKLSESMYNIESLQQKLTSTEDQLSQAQESSLEVQKTLSEKQVSIAELEDLLREKQQQLSSMQTVVSFKDQELTESSIEESDAQATLRSENENLEKQLQGVYSSVAELQKKSVDLENALIAANIEKEREIDAKNELESEIDILKSKIDEFKSQLPEKETTEDISGTSFFDSIAVSKDEDMNLNAKIHELEIQKNSLKNQLEEAKQAITRLETSLATQNISSEEPADSWGVIDLGQPAGKDLSSSMQTALSEKDKTLTVIQEQLKDALQQVNSALDEKKLVGHQLKTLEAELEHKENTIKKYIEQLASLEKTVDSEKSKKSTVPESDETTTSNWFNKKTTEDNVSSLWNTVGTDSTSDVVKEVTSSEKESADTNVLSAEAIAELQYKLSWYEEQWALWTDNFNQLYASLQSEEQNRISAEEQIGQLNKALEEAKVTLSQTQSTSEEQVQQLKVMQEQVNQLHAEKDNLQQTIKQLESNLEVTTGEIQKVENLQNLQTEMQSIIQENATKNEGSKSRIQELELIVQSAESEIGRLRTDMVTLTTAGKALETERASLQEELTNLKEELRKNNIERERIQSEYDKLNEQTATQSSINTEILATSQRNSELNAQLQSEIEVLEGDAGRLRMDYDILETDNSRLREENLNLSQNNQFLEAQVESSTTEMVRLSDAYNSLQTEKDHLKEETQRLLEVSTSAESEISRLKNNISNNNELEMRYQELMCQYSELQAKVAYLEAKEPVSHGLDDVDWSSEGKLEIEHLQASDSNQSNEIEALKIKAIDLEKERNQLSEELHASKVKNGKMIQKVKANNLKVVNLQKQLDDLKNKTSGFSDLDLAMEVEWKAQIDKAQSERDEYKTKLDELEKEKNSVSTQLEVFQRAQDKYIELKEAQDASIHHYTEKNKALETQVNALEWKISELEEALEHNGSVPKTQVEIDTTKKVQDLEKEIGELKIQNADLTNNNQKIQELLDTLQQQYNELQETKDRIESSATTYKSSYLELYNEHEKLEGKDKGASEVQNALEYKLNTLEASYNAIYYEYEALQLSQLHTEREFSVAKAENEKLKEEVESLQNQLAILKEEEEEDIIRALQDECESLRETISKLKDQAIELTENLRAAETEAEKTKYSLEEQTESLEMTREELGLKVSETDHLSSVIESLKKDLQYEKAEIASLKSQVSGLRKEAGIAQDQLKGLKEKSNDMKTDVMSDVGSTDMKRMSESTDKGDISFDASQVSQKLNDFRYKQMAVEINKLIEERDALQLKLSSSLRHNQQLERELSFGQHLPQPTPSSSLLRVKLEELRELNSSLEERAAQDSFNSNLPPTLPTFVSHTAPPTPTASRHTDISISREAHGASSTIANWILGKSTTKEVLHI